MKISFARAKRLAFGTALGLLLSGAACSHKEAPPPPPPAAPPPAPAPAPEPPAPPPATLGAITLGNAIGADKKVSAPLDAFSPKDTIYASVETTGVGNAVPLKAKWTFTDKKGKVIPVHEDALTLDLKGPATNEFHIEKKTPWPKGSYDVEVSLGDKPAEKKSFTVK